MAFVSSGKTRIFWNERGAGTPVVLVMGHRYSSAMWYPVLDYLAARHRVIWYDNRGTGQSGRSANVSITDFVNDTLAVMDAAGIAKAHVFGVSMGGGIVLEMSRTHAERMNSMILGCTCALTPDKPRTKAWMRALYFLPPFILKALMKPKVANKGYGSMAPLDGVKRDLAVLAKDPFSVRGVHAQAVAISKYSIERDAVKNIQVPALVMHGDEDAAVPYAWGVELAELLPHSEFVHLRGAGHNYLVAAPDQSQKAITEFLDRMDTQAPVPA
ncbi:Putative non-heme bromoperoxidase BpoC [Alphaproteobacteria bacterium SO-S41]|nr:Putative non-heme bromoperoxidase BpoC [Alphaproteobacteria bacterium SO-S41]